METPAGTAVGVALIGYGLAGRSFHAPLITAVPGLRLTAVVTADAGRAAQVRAEHPGVAVLRSADALWGAGLAEVVVVATPNRTHVPLARAALDAGLHVVIDKPLAPTAAAARQLIEEAARRGRLLTVFQNRRWDGDFLTVQRLIGAGELGRVLRFESRFERWRAAAKPGWRQAGAPEEAGGLLYDLGAHLIDQALLLFGPPVHVYAELVRRRPGAQVDDDSFVAIRHASGVVSHLWMSELVAQPGPRFRVLGSASAFTKHGLDVQEALLRAGRRPGPGWAAEPEERWGLLGHTGGMRRVPTEEGAWVTFYERVLTSVRDGAPVPVDPRDAVAVLAVIEAARERNEEGS